MRIAAKEQKCGATDVLVQNLLRDEHLYDLTTFWCSTDRHGLQCSTDLPRASARGEKISSVFLYITQ